MPEQLAWAAWQMDQEQALDAPGLEGSARQHTAQRQGATAALLATVQGGLRDERQVRRLALFKTSAVVGSSGGRPRGPGAGQHETGVVSVHAMTCPG